MRSAVGPRKAAARIRRRRLLLRAPARRLRRLQSCQIPPGQFTQKVEAGASAAGWRQRCCRGRSGGPRPARSGLIMLSMLGPVRGVIFRGLPQYRDLLGRARRCCSRCRRRRMPRVRARSSRRNAGRCGRQEPARHPRSCASVRRWIGARRLGQRGDGEGRFVRRRGGPARGRGSCRADSAHAADRQRHQGDTGVIRCSSFDRPPAPGRRAAWLRRFPRLQRWPRA